MRRLAALALTSAVTIGGVAGLGVDPAGSRSNTAGAEDYVVLFARSASAADARAAVARAGGRILAENPDLGTATVESRDPRFISRVGEQAALEGAARNRPIGYAPGRSRKGDDVERLGEERSTGATAAPSGTGGETPASTPPPFEPLAHLQWGMAMINATPDGSHRVQRGDRRVVVGILDTGIDGRHPDLAPNFDAALSRNFTTDIPLVDGPCDEEPDRSCSDPADVDENGHGTHVAGIVGAAVNGLGVAGVAPDVRLVNLRAGQDSGYFFLAPTLDALTYAANHGVDVVNMSYFIDPWLYNCPDNPADSPEAQAEQRAIVRATRRALDYAHAGGVTLVSSLGNEHTDTGNPTYDDISPDFPPGASYPRTVDNSCVTMPTEGPHVIGVSALGPTKRKADYSNYGLEGADVSAPGGYYRDYWGATRYRNAQNLVLSTYPRDLARADRRDDFLRQFVVRNCNADGCAFYEYLQGTSMAAPHVAGVAALIVSQYGAETAGGFGLAPDRVREILQRTATDHPCPDPPVLDYPDRDDSYTARCDGPPRKNGFYGHGIVDALRAVGG